MNELFYSLPGSYVVSSPGGAKLSVLHLSSAIGKRSFGIGSAVLGLVASQRDLGLNADIWSNDHPSEVYQLHSCFGESKSVIHPFRPVGPRRLSFSPLLLRALLARSHEFDIVHQHNLWTGASLATNLWRRSTGRPTVVAPHGTLEPWAMRRSVAKKRIALYLYQRENLRSASCLHALSLQEARDFRGFGLTNPIAVIPNGVSEAWLDSRGESASFRTKYGLSCDERIILFLGRITPKKGLMLLLPAMATLKDKLSNWRLIIAGDDEFNHQQEIERLAAGLELEPYVKFVGSVYGQNKRDAFAAAEVFILPSFSEGAPMTILEALGAGVPVVATTASPWEQLLTQRCGWWITASQRAFAQTLEEVIESSPDVLRTMGIRGKHLVRQSYTWSGSAEKSRALYNWLITGHDKPEFVLTDGQ